MSKIRLSVAAMTLCALVLGVSVATPASSQSVRNNVSWVEVVADPTGAGPRTVWQSSMNYVPRLGEMIEYDSRFAAEEVIEVRWGPLHRRSRDIQLLIVLESAAGCCD